MAITITNTQGQTINTEDIAPNKQTFTQIGAAIKAARQNKDHQSYAYVDMTDHTKQYVIVTNR